MYSLFTYGHLFQRKEELPLECEIYWSGVGWKSTPPRDHSVIDQQVELMRSPNADICKALDLFYSRFYPESIKETVEDIVNKAKVAANRNPIEEATLPWIGHKAAKKYYKDETSYETALRSKLMEDWLLSWHWRALLPSVKDWEKKQKHEKFVLQICQIQKWELSLLYKIQITSDDWHKSQDVHKDKQLLRAPIFGVSHRIYRWDAYRIFYNPTVIKDIESEMATTKDPFELAHILGRHDVYHILDKIELLTDRRDGGVGQRYRVKYNLKIDLHPERTKLDPDGPKTASDNGPTWFFNPKDLVHIPTFEQGGEGLPLLLSSENYCIALSQLTELMNDPLAKTLLLIAPPGSGKEALARAASLCRDIGEKSDSRGSFQAVNLAGLDAAEAARMLFSLGDSAKRINPGGNMLKSDFVPHDTDGLFFKSLNGALFIDEIDKTDGRGDIRTMLLRLLESNEVTIPGTPRVVSIPSEKIPLYIFAGSMTRKEILEQDPIDFWTRISHIVEMSHPLDIKDTNVKKRVIKAYVWLFWLRKARNYLKDRKLIYDRFDSNKKKNEEKKRFYKPLSIFFKEFHNFILSKSVLDFVSDELSEVIVGRGGLVISIRTIQNIVSRAIFFFVECILYEKSDNSPVEVLRRKYDKELGPKLPSNWFEKIGYLLQKRLSCSERYELEFIDYLRRKIRNSATSIL